MVSFLFACFGWLATACACLLVRMSKVTGLCMRGCVYFLYFLNSFGRRGVSERSPGTQTRGKGLTGGVLGDMRGSPKPSRGWFPRNRTKPKVVPIHDAV